MHSTQVGWSSRMLIWIDPPLWWMCFFLDQKILVYDPFYMCFFHHIFILQYFGLISLLEFLTRIWNTMFVTSHLKCYIFLYPTGWLIFGGQFFEKFEILLTRKKSCKETDQVPLSILRGTMVHARPNSERNWASSCHPDNLLNKRFMVRIS